MTTTMNNDEIIAVFMGWTIDNSFPDKNFVYRLGNRIETKNTFKFSRSWDAFMEAYKKFHVCLSELHKSMPPNTACQGDLIEVDIECAVMNFDLKNAHFYLVAGINWYNEYHPR